MDLPPHEKEQDESGQGTQQGGQEEQRKYPALDGRPMSVWTAEDGEGGQGGMDLPPHEMAPPGDTDERDMDLRDHHRGTPNGRDHSTPNGRDHSTANGRDHSTPSGRDQNTPAGSSR